MTKETEYTACALDPLLTSSQQANSVRRSQEAPVRILVDAIPQIVWTAQPDGTRDYFNQRWYEHTGFTADEMQAEDWVNALHEQDRERCLLAWQQAVQDRESFEVEYRLFCAEDSSYRCHIERALPLLDPSAVVVKWFGTCTDIEELKRARAEIEDLNLRLQRAMTETHHRVKNNLQLILAMVDLQLTDEGEMISQEELKRLGGHIRTIAAVHDLLTQAMKERGHAEAISMKAILEQMLPIHQQTAPQCRIRAEIAEVELPGRKGTALALAINELISNAIKHGKSLVEIVVGAEPDHIDVSVCDDGPGFPPNFDAAQAANTGLELVENLVRWDLNGRITYGNQPQGGAQVTLNIPT